MKISLKEKKCFEFESKDLLQNSGVDKSGENYLSQIVQDTILYGAAEERNGGGGTNFPMLQGPIGLITTNASRSGGPHKVKPVLALQSSFLDPVFLHGEGLVSPLYPGTSEVFQQFYIFMTERTLPS